MNHQTGECSLPDCFCHEAQRIPAVRTVFGHHLDQCSICSCVAKQFPDLELFDHQLCPEGRQLFRNPSQSITVPTFEQEWHDAPRWTTRYTERESDICRDNCWTTITNQILGKDGNKDAGV